MEKTVSTTQTDESRHATFLAAQRESFRAPPSSCTVCEATLKKTTCHRTPHGARSAPRRRTPYDPPSSHRELFQNLV